MAIAGVKKKQRFLEGHKDKQMLHRIVIQLVCKGFHWALTKGKWRLLSVLGFSHKTLSFHSLGFPSRKVQTSLEQKTLLKQEYSFRHFWLAQEPRKTTF